MDIKSLVDRLAMGIFFPRKTEPPKEDKSKLRVLRFEVAENIILGGILYLGKNYTELPTVIFFHGNGETANDYSYFASEYLNCGMNLAVFDFRGYGFSTGDPRYSALFKDPIVIYEKFSKWLEREYSGTISQILFVMGRSLGSTCASALAAENPAKLHGIIIESGFASISRMIDLISNRYPEVDFELLKPFSNDTYLSRIKKPCLIIHGERDNIIPFSEGEELFYSIPENVEKKFVGIQRASHNTISSFEEEYYPPIREFIEKYK
ncbi:MAG: alpha/beta hydrolase [Promethearchaeota archaeon]